MNLYDKLKSWQQEYEDEIMDCGESVIFQHLRGLHEIILQALRENKQTHWERKAGTGTVKLSKAWTSPHTGETRVYCNGLKLGEGYKVFFLIDDAGNVDCRMTLPREVWQDTEKRDAEQARFAELKTELIDTHEAEVRDLITKEN